MANVNQIVVNSLILLEIQIVQVVRNQFLKNLIRVIPGRYFHGLDGPRGLLLGPPENPEGLL